MNLRDFVKCTYCESERCIGLGENICPCCGKEGTLQWGMLKCNRCKEEIFPQEVEYPLLKKEWLCDLCKEI